MVGYPDRPGGGDRPGKPGGIGDGKPGGIGDGRPGGIGDGKPGGIGGVGGPGKPGGIGGPGKPGGIGKPGRPGGIGGIGGVGIAGGIGAIGGIGGVGGIGGIGGPGGPGGPGGWDGDKWGGDRGIWGGGNNRFTNIDIDNNFRRNNNFAGGPHHWGGHPWWGAGHWHGWHHGHWGHGWNHHYWNSCWWWDDDDDFGKGFMWGIAAWSLGSMIFDMGYDSYHNPYASQAPPVENTTVVYTQPMSVSASESAPPGDEQALASAEEKASDAVDTSRDAFKKGDYPSALKSCDEAIASTPDDITLHEYRALILFALGRYGEAAAVLNPVLASGPGWSWDTMVGFYSSSTVYDEQLRKLESWVKATPDKAEGHFLLAYHYLVCGHMDKAYEQFADTAKLQPEDGVARQMRDLTKDSIPDNGESETQPPPKPDPVPKEKLVGTWTSDASGGKVTFKLEEDGSFLWSFTGDGETHDLKGTWGINDKDLLVMNVEDSQMVCSISLEDDSTMKFLIIGGPSGDPGLDFKKA
ncbi:tetratricopeptide repeat protein [Haloferula chungangensis]|uniref:Tetratricopeptide repeat protein n=1 Tax=Haloferula chungangensis TaxID=1048331 RepID=A0ABW2L3V8_9BACT